MTSLPPEIIRQLFAAKLTWIKYLTQAKSFGRTLLSAGNALPKDRSSALICALILTVYPPKNQSIAENSEYIFRQRKNREFFTPLPLVELA